MRPPGPEEHPAFEALLAPSLADAFGCLLARTEPTVGQARAQAVLDALGTSFRSPSAIRPLIDHLYSVATPSAGALALAWSMLTVDPRRPESFRHVLPQLQYALDHAGLDERADAELRARIRIWWRAAEGEWTSSVITMFRLAERETSPEADIEPIPDSKPVRDETTKKPFKPPGPTLVVMPAARATKLNNYNAPFKEIVDAALPLVVARDVASIRAALHAEFPHATVAVDLLIRDLREGQPVTLKPMLLVGSPGSGKSRLVRRLAEILRLFIHRYDAAASSDNHFGGTSKSWGNTEASVPARAVGQSRTANPIVLVDEIEKASASKTNGRLADALLPFLDRETAGRYRDQSLDAELDLSRVTFIATANDDTRLPTPLRDRFRIIRVAAPTLQHLPQLAAQVVRDLSANDETRAHDAPLADDELAVISKAWSRSGFSMRNLQKIVSATLEARDQYAMRH
ncbi:AAA family ATPase [Tardiphaga sp. 813_E8_N1_3]|uniref:AAA family ATPase n=1 Tax=Tardiphaga sp. 813_E8_N1_3 TaxID=3240760 RepID=UPI003F27ECD8